MTTYVKTAFQDSYALYAYYASYASYEHEIFCGKRFHGKIEQPTIFFNIFNSLRYVQLQFHDFGECGFICLKTNIYYRYAYTLYLFFGSPKIRYSL